MGVGRRAFVCVCASRLRLARVETAARRSRGFTRARFLAETVETGVDRVPWRVFASRRGGSRARSTARDRAGVRASEPSYLWNVWYHTLRDFMLAVVDKIVSRAYVRVRTLVVSDFRYVFY